MCVCLSVCSHAYLGKRKSELHQIFRAFFRGVARFFSSSSVIRYVRPVLWMTSFFSIMAPCLRSASAIVSQQCSAHDGGRAPRLEEFIMPGRVRDEPFRLVYFNDNFGKYGPILTIVSLLQQEIYGAQNLSYFSHLTFIMLLHYRFLDHPVYTICRPVCLCGKWTVAKRMIGSGCRLGW